MIVAVCYRPEARQRPYIRGGRARVFDTYRNFIQGHEDAWDHACNIICAGAGTEDQACVPAEGLALAWEVLRSAGLRQCFEGWTRGVIHCDGRLWSSLATLLLRLGCRMPRICIELN